MRQLTIILLFAPLLTSATVRYDVNKFFGEDFYMHYVIAVRADSLTVHYEEYINIGEYIEFKKERFWTNYTWSTSNGNVLINSANYPTLGPNDTVFVGVKTGGYRSYSIANVGLASWSADAVVYWQTGAYISPNTSSPRFANTIDNSHHIQTYGWVFNDQIDVAFYQYASTGYSTHMSFINCSFRGTNGFFPSSFPGTSTLPSYTGGSDTTNCFYRWTWNNCSWDSIVGANYGQTALWLGKIDPKWTFVRAAITNCYFGHYAAPNAPQTGGPATYIGAWNVWGLYVSHCTFEQLGMDVANHVGHATNCYFQMCYYEVWDCQFINKGFGNAIRAWGNGCLWDVTLLSTWGSSNFDGRCRIWNCIRKDSEKYPFLDTRTSPSDATTLGYCQSRTSPEVWFITDVRAGTGAANSTGYVSSIVDCYETDSLFLKMSASIGPSDTTWGACTSTTCVKLITLGVVSTAVWDTAGNRWVSSSLLAGLLDSTATLHPLLNAGMLDNQTIAVDAPSWITDDYYGTPRTRRTIGAVLPILPATNQRIHYKFHKNISTWSH